MFTFGFYNSLNGDRRYDAVQISSIFDGIIEDGVFSNVGEFFATVPGTGMQVIVKTGRAWFKHTWNLNDAWMLLNIDSADILRPRIDSVVLEVNSNVDVRENSIKIVKGTPANSPVAPEMIHSDGIDQYRLANINVPASATNIVANNITIVVGSSETPFVTAPLKSIDISDFLQGCQESFNEWFDELKEIMTENVATKLQKEIDERVKIIDKASFEDASNNTPDKWVDSQLLSAFVGLDPSLTKQVTQTLTTSGSWVAPNNIANNEITVICVGGGGGGAGGYGTYGNTGPAGGGGGSGYITINKMTVTPGKSYSYIIGAGGTGGLNGNSVLDGGTGGVTSFNGTFHAQGGNGGKGSTSTKGGDGGDGFAGGGAGGTASLTTVPGNGGNGSYGGGGGAGGATSTSTIAHGGNGGMYGGGGGGGGSSSSGAKPATGGNGGMYGGNGGSTTNSKGTNGKFFTYSPLKFYPYIIENLNGLGGGTYGGGGGGGGFGGDGGYGSNTGTWTGGGGGGIGANGGNGRYGGGGGGGLGGNGGIGGSSAQSAGGGGGGGFFRTGTDTYDVSGQGYGAGGGGNGPGRAGEKGINGCVVIIFQSKD